MKAADEVRDAVVKAVANAFAVDGLTRDDLPELHGVARAEAARHGARLSSTEARRLVRAALPEAVHV